MDYQEAIKEAETQIDTYESMILYNKDFEPKNDNSNYERKVDFLKTAISAMQELEKYKKLGTLEEVRDAVEIQKPKKVVIERWSPSICPRCGNELSENLGDGYYKHPVFLERCPNPDCAQRLDWSEEE